MGEATRFPSHAYQASPSISEKNSKAQTQLHLFFAMRDILDKDIWMLLSRKLWLLQFWISFPASSSLFAIFRAQDS